MRKYMECKIISNEKIATNIFDMQIEFDEDLSTAKAGQFVQLYTNCGEMLLPRPISICEIDRENRGLRLIYQIAGKGTAYFTTLKKDDNIKVMGTLGNGFNILAGKKKVAVVGGGVGVPPMLELTKAILTKMPDVDIDVFLGFRSEPILYNDFIKLGVRAHIATDDGSVGYKGNVIQLMESVGYDCEVIYSCGPKIMLKFLYEWSAKKEIPCYVSMEERMACGLGACVGCAIPVKTKKGDDFFYKKVCKEGPVFSGAEVIWDGM